jgi:hypothetical protein
MKRQRMFPLFLLLVLAVALLGAARVSALAGYTLDWWTVDGGGGSSTGGSYTLGGTLGQPEPGLSEGGAYTLSGGFWGGGSATALSYPLYLPLVKR